MRETKNNLQNHFFFNAKNMIFDSFGQFFWHISKILFALNWLRSQTFQTVFIESDFNIDFNIEARKMQKRPLNSKTKCNKENFKNQP